MNNAFLSCPICHPGLLALAQSKFETNMFVYKTAFVNEGSKITRVHAHAQSLNPF